METIRRTLIALIAAACACGHDGRADDGPDNPDEPPPPGSHSTVAGRFYNTCHQIDGEVDVPVDLSRTVIRAWIPDPGPTGFRAVAGTGLADGTFSIPDVPDGVVYLLNIGVAYYATDQHTLTSHGGRTGRCMPMPFTTTASTPVTFSLSGITPYSTSTDQVDRIEVRSVALPYQLTVRSQDVLVGTPPEPTIGTFDWASTRPAPLLDAAAGDDLRIFHVRTDRERDAVAQKERSIIHLIDQFEASGVTVQGGIPLAIEGAFQPISEQRTATFAIDRAALEAGYDSSGYRGPLSVQIFAHPRSSSGGVRVVGFELSDTSRSADPVSRITSYPYADPFPASWKRLVVIGATRTRSLEFASLRLSSSTQAGITQLFALEDGIAPLPALAPPSGIAIGGADFLLGGQIAFDGHTPIAASWNPVPGATRYVLSASRVAGASGSSFFATFTTAETSLRLPAELFAGPLFASGAYFVFTLTASRSSVDYGAGQLAGPSLPLQSTSVISGRFRFLASCGDGAVQVFDEECDTAGESDTCNVDCTTAKCGDGLRNAAAGERCDDGGLNGLSACSTSCRLQ